MKPQKREVSRFLNSLWPNGLPAGSWLTSAWKNADGQFHQRSWNNLDHAAIAITQRTYQSDTYISCGVPDFKPNDDRRALAHKVRYLPGFWLDIDFGTDGHGSGSYPPTIEQAYQLLAIAPIPTLVVESGHGLQVWWLFNEPYEITNDASRQRLVSTFASLHDTVLRAAKQNGWKIDSTHDLARLLRPVGTLNHKDPDDVRPVILAIDDGPRWWLEDIERELDSEELPKTVELIPPPVSKEKVESESSDIPWAGINSSPVGRSLLAGELLGYGSASERDAALAKVAVNSGASRDHVQALFRIRRTAAGENAAKAERDDYVDRTYEFVKSNNGELPLQPDDLLTDWYKEILPRLILSERQSVARVLVHMVQNARGVRFMGTRPGIEKGLACDPKTVSYAWKRLELLGFIKPINKNPYEGFAKGWIFLLPILTNNQGNRFPA
ncbi:hypothetical protein FIL92_00885 [SAR202 cluster bacterium AD-812-D07_MRT_10900m]|nr:hypothetical protein [SAR202 cluster bacterium AD-812-D07_MRT_10900m]